MKRRNGERARVTIAHRAELAVEQLQGAIELIGNLNVRLAVKNEAESQEPFAIRELSAFVASSITLALR